MPGRKVRKPKQNRTGKPKTGPRIKWTNLKAPSLAQGKAAERFFKLETMASAIEKLTGGSDRVITPSLKSTMGLSRITSMVGEVVNERRYQLTLRIKATNTNRKRGSVRVIVAKNNQEFSTQLTTEHHFLQELHKKKPKLVISAGRTGVLFLPDRYRRSSNDRELFFYVTPWINGETLGIGKGAQFTAMGQRPHMFSAVETEHLKCKIIELLAGTYDFTARTGLDMRDLKLDDFLVAKPGKAMPRLTLCACRAKGRQQPNVFLDRILEKAWKGRAGGAVALCPNDPAMFHKALVSGCGPEQANRWLTNYLALPANKRKAQIANDYLDVLRELAGVE